MLEVCVCVCVWWTADTISLTVNWSPAEGQTIAATGIAPLDVTQLECVQEKLILREMPEMINR